LSSISLFGSAASINVIIAFVFALILLYLVLRLILSSLRNAGRMLLRVGVSALALILVNLIGSRFGYAVPLNLVTVLLPTALGVPGFFLATLLQFLLF
jgi:inhibitor of the pro-sigma K processing machinery